MLILLLTLGLFFAISGYYKIFDPSVHANICKLFNNLHLPPFSCIVTMWGEFIGGLALLASLLVNIPPLVILDCIGLIVILMGAICTDCIHEIRARHPHGLTWISKSMMNVEVDLSIMLLALMVLEAHH